MSWNFRITTKQVGDTTLYGLCEVYYRKDGSVKGYTDWIDPNGWNNKEDLKITLENMLKAFDKPEFLDK